MIAPTSPLKAAFTYAILGGLWIVLSDKVMGWIFVGRSALQAVQTIKGLIFIALTTVMVYWLARRATMETERDRAWYHALFEFSPDALFVTGSDGRFVEVNDVAVKRYGYSLAELLDMGPADLTAPALLPLVEERLKEALKNAARFEWRHVTKDGREIEVDVAHRPVKRYGKPCFLSTVRDMTAVKQTEEALRESEARYRLLADNTLDVIWLMDMDLRFTYVNPSVERMFGYTPEEFVGTRLSDHCAPARLERMSAIVAHESRHLDEHRGVIFETVLRRKDQTPIPVEIHGTFLFDHDRRTIGLQGTTRDISERKKAELEQSALEDQLRQSQKMESIGRLAGGVAHDFNNMLSIIIGNAELALDGLDPADPLHARIMEIMRAGERSADLTRSLLAFARKQTITPKALDLNDTVAGMLKMLGRLIGEDIDLLCKPGKELWPVKMDPAQLNQILANLVVNSRDAIEGVGKITIETENAELDEDYCAQDPDLTPGRYVTLAVNDTGSGMDKETLASIFEPFYTTKPQGEGTGLGLAMIYGIVKQNDGLISVYSEKGNGASFRIYLPALIDREARIEESPEALTSAETGSETILLVEDEAPLLELNERLLRKLGYKTLAVDTPGKALELVQQYPDPIHLVLTDVVMPEMDGLALWRRLTELRPGLKCLFMSGYTANVIAHRGVLDQNVHFLQKPFSRKSLAAKIRETLKD